MNRRNFLKWTCGTAAALTLPLSAAELLADTCCRLSWKDLLKLNAARFVAGLVWDQVEPVLLEAASGAVDWLLYEKLSYSRAPMISSYRSLPVNEQLNHQEYRASIVIYGLADYELRPQNAFALKLRNEEEKQRLLALRDYMVKNRIRIKTWDDDPAKGGRTHLVLPSTSLDDLLSIDHMDTGSQSATLAHYQAMEAITGATVFQTWSA